MPPNEAAPELTESIGQLLTRIDELKSDYREDGANKAEIDANIDAAIERITALEAERTERETNAAFDAKVSDAVNRAMALQRTPSKAHLIGTGQNPNAEAEGLALYPLVAIAYAENPKKFRDQHEAGKAALEDLGMVYAMPDPAAKATLGTTDGSGGYLIPNNVVRDIVEQAQPGRQVVDLFNVIDGVVGTGVDQPWESSVDSRAVIAAAGATKENSAFVVDNYTATLYTLARIFDVGNQLLRNSRGAAERLVRNKLAKAFAAGEDYYALQGTGSSEPMGLLTAIGTSGTYVSTFSSPSDSTVAGSVLSAITVAAGDLEDRGATADGVVLNTGDWWRMARQGADAAGFYLEPGPLGDVTRSTMTLWGLLARKSNRMPTDNLVVGEYKSTEFYRGLGYRVDTSTEAGDRWDKNLTGFRGEEEIAFDPRPAVFTGHFQRIVNVHA